MLRVIGVSRSPLLLARKQQNQDQCLGGRPPASVWHPVTSIVPRGPAGSSALRRGRPGTGADARVGIPQSGSLQGGYFSLCHVDLAVCRADVESESRRLAERSHIYYVMCSGRQPRRFHLNNGDVWEARPRSLGAEDFCPGSHGRPVEEEAETLASGILDT